MSKVKHILGISGGKDSAALALYLNRLYPDLDIEYYTCDTGRELNETYQLINRLESYMGKSIKQLDAVDLSNNSLESSFDYFLDPITKKTTTVSPTNKNPGIRLAQEGKTYFVSLAFL